MSVYKNLGGVGSYMAREEGGQKGKRGGRETGRERGRREGGKKGVGRS